MSYSLLLGDIIRIQAPKNKDIDTNIYLIDYIDDKKVLLQSPSSNYELTIRDNRFTDETIIQLELLYRNDKIGFVEQNDYTIGKWLHIYFAGQFPFIVTGEITNIEEDAIEVKTHPQDEIIYIDFAYKGLPQHLFIEKIVLLDASPLHNTDTQSSIGDTDLKNDTNDDFDANVSATQQNDVSNNTDTMTVSNVENDETDNFIVEEDDFHPDEVFDIPQEPIEVHLEQAMQTMDEIILGEELGSVEQFEKVDSSQQRYGIDLQTNDLLNSILSLSSSKQSLEVQANAHVIIQRYKELRESFTQFDEFKNPDGIKHRGDNYKPLVNSLLYLRNTFPWILPIVSHKRKVYSVEGVGDESDYRSDFSEMSMNDELELIQKLGINSQGEDGHYNAYMSNIQRIFTPVLPPMMNDMENYWNTPLQSSFMNCIVENTDRYTSTTISDARGDLVLNNKQFMIENYLRDEVLYVKGFIVLPFSVANTYSSQDYLRNKMFLNKIELDVLQTEQVFKNQSIHNIYVHEDRPHTIDFELYGKKPVRYEFESNVEYTNNLFQNLFEKMIPNTRELIMNYPMNNYPSFNSVVEQLEAFHITSDDVSYKTYEVIQKKVLAFQQELLAKRKTNDLLFKQYKTRAMDLQKDVSTRTSHKDDNIDIQYQHYQHESRTDISQNEENQNENNFTTHEQLYHMTVSDEGNVFHIANAIKNIPLISERNLQDTLKYYDDKYNKSLHSTDDCETINVSKKYSGVSELEQDNEKEIYYDANYDDTVYDIMDVYKSEESKMEKQEFFLFLKDKLQNVNGLDEILSEITAESLIEGKRKVRENDVAFIENFDEDGIEYIYFRRKENVWKQDELLTKKHNKNMAIMMNEKTNDHNVGKELCNTNTDCLKTNNDCENMHSLYTEKQRELLKRMIHEFEHEHVLREDRTTAEMEKIFEKKRMMLNKIKILRQNDNNKYVKFEKMLAGYIDEELNQEYSPHIDVFDRIMREQDISIKYDNLIRFAFKYTREASDTECSGWRYCLDTNLKLMPNFLYLLAMSYTQQNEYQLELKRICKLYGKASDDGDSWVDQYSGMVICMNDYSNADTYDETGRKVVQDKLDEKDEFDEVVESMNKDDNNDESEEDEDFIFEVNNMLDNAEQNHAQPNSESERIYLNLDLLLRKMSIHMRNPEKEFIVFHVSNVFQTRFGNKQMKDSNKRKVYVLLLLGVTLIALQLSDKDFKSKRTTPGCIQSFKGFPLFDEGDMEGVEYLSCIAHNLSREKNKMSMFTEFKKTTQIQIQNTVKQAIVNHLLINDVLVRKMKHKRKLMNNIDKEENNLSSSFSLFLPPLEPFEMKIVSNFTPAIFENMKDQFRASGNKQKDKLYGDMLKSKIIELSYGVLYLIQKVLNSKKAILKNIHEEPFIENACCSALISEQSIAYDYFKKADMNIEKYHEMITINANVMERFIKFQMPTMLWTKYQLRVRDDFHYTGFHEETIYRVFLHYCKWNKNNQSYNNQRELIDICGDAEDIFHLHDPIHMKIKKLQDAGKLYNNDMCLMVMKRIAKRNQFNIYLDDNMTTSVERLRSFVNTQDGQHVTLFSHLKTLFDKYELRTNDRNRLSDVLPLETFLSTENSNYIVNILQFLKDESSLSQNDYKSIQSTLKTFMNFDKSLYNTYKHENTHIDSNTLHNMVKFIQNITRELISVMPHYLKNHIKTKMKKPTGNPNYDRLSSTHKDDISEFVEKYFEAFSSIQIDNELGIFLTDVMKDSKEIIHLMNITPVLNPYMKASTNNAIEHPILNELTIQELYRYYLLFTLNKHIELLDNLSNTQQEDVYTQMRGNVATLLSKYIMQIEKYKKNVNHSYESIMKKVLHSREKEKSSMRQRLENMNEHELEVERYKKLHKMGVWNKGLQKGVFAYDIDTYEAERAELSGESDVYVSMEIDEQNNIGHLHEDYQDGFDQDSADI